MRRLATVLGTAAIVAAASGCVPWMDAPGLIGTRNISSTNTQGELDRGRVVNWTGCWPGRNDCVVWLAGHRSTHGSTFANVPALRPGNFIRLGYGGKIHHYVVTHSEVACCAGDTYTPKGGDLVLQTSLGGGRALMVYADEV